MGSTDGKEVVYIIPKVSQSVGVSPERLGILWRHRGDADRIPVDFRT